jgi:hypothetical protein
VNALLLPSTAAQNDAVGHDTAVRPRLPSMSSGEDQVPPEYVIALGPPTATQNEDEAQETAPKA